MRVLAALCLGLLTTAASAEPAACGKRCTSWPLRFFAGQSFGQGRQQVLFLPPKALRVSSQGRLATDGTLVLWQTIRRAGEAATKRVWRLKQVSPGRYAGTLTEAAGPVTGEVTGTRLYLRYTMKGPLRIRISQRLDLAPDGRTIDNRLEASTFGVPIASVRETIRKAR